MKPQPPLPSGDRSPWASSSSPMAASLVLNAVLGSLLLSLLALHRPEDSVVLECAPSSSRHLRTALPLPQDQSDGQPQGQGQDEPQPLSPGVPSLLLQPWGDGELQRLLARAEEAYKYHLARVWVLAGTEEEVSFPAAPEFVVAVARAHGIHTGPSKRRTIRPWAQPYVQEYMTLPRYPCFEELRVGVWGDGGKWLCMIPLRKASGDLTVYSIGSRGETTFERDMHDLFGVKPHVFDPFVGQPVVQALRAVQFLTFHEYGLAATNSISANGTVFKDLRTVMKELGHSFIDVFKLDCDGCEWDVVASFVNLTTRGEPIFGQIQIELHHLHEIDNDGNVLWHLRRLGYRMFHSEPNYFIPGKAMEFSFIHESLVKPSKDISRA